MIYRFGLFELDTAAAELLRDGRRVPLQEQPLAVLLALVENPGRVVERDELRRRLWPEDVHVEVDNGINTAVARLREALGDAAGNPRFIATVPRRGYRFIAPVERRVPTTAPGSSVAPAASAEPVPSLATRLSPLLIPLLLALAVAVYQVRRPADEPPIAPSATFSTTDPSTAGLSTVRLAVLPFLDLGESAETSALGVGLTEELISRLGQLQPERLRVIARTSVMSYREGADLDDLARRLRVRYFLEGTVQNEGDSVRVSAALVETAGQTRLWNATYDRRLDSLMAVEQDIATAVARALAPELEIEPPTVSSLSDSAHAKILEGRFFLAQRTEAGFRKALEAFEAAVVEAPESAEAHAYLAAAWAYLALFDFIPRAEALPRAEVEVARALALAPDLAEGHLVQAALHFYFHWRFDAAEASIERALRGNPSSVTAQLLAANFRTCMGRTADAKAALAQALALDPLSPATFAEAAWLYFVNGADEAAERSIRRALELQPEFLEAWDVEKWMAIVRGEEERAIEAFLRVVTLERLHALEVEGLADLAEEEGIRGLLRVSLLDPESRLREVGQSPYNLALDHASLGEAEKALDALERAFTSRESDLVAIGVDPRLRLLHSEPRFRDLFARVGLPPRLLER